MEKFLHRIITAVLLLFVSISIAQPLIRAYYHLVNPDVAYHYLMGKYILNGEKPYVDFIDMNFPTIWYLSTIPSFISKFARHDVWIIVLFFLCLTISCCYLLSRIVSLVTEILSFEKSLFLSLCVFALTAFQQNEFGQREHLFVVGFLPFLLLKVYFKDIQKQASNLLVFITAFIGSYIVWVKPHYVILYFIIEILFLFKNRRFPKGTLLIGQITGIFIGALPLLLYLPQYLSVAKLAASTYTPQTIDPNEIAFISILTQRGSWFVYLSIVFFALSFKQQKLRFLNSSLLITAILTWFVAIAQNKAYPYHIKPASTFAVISILISILRIFQTFSWFTLKRQYAIAVLLFMILSARTIVVSLPPKNIEVTAPATAMTLRTVSILNKYKDARTVYKLASSAQPLYPGIIVTKYIDVTGINSFWYLGSFYRNLDRTANNSGNFPYHAPDRMPVVEKMMFNKTIDNLLNKRPDLLIIDNLKNPAFFDKSAQSFSFYDYYSQDNRFVELISHYKLTDSADGYKWYLKVR